MGLHFVFNIKSICELLDTQALKDEEEENEEEMEEANE